MSSTNRRWACFPMTMSSSCSASLSGGPVIGAALGWLIDKEASRQRQSGKVD